MGRLLDSCWVCQNLHEPASLVVYESRTCVAKLNPDQLFRGYTFVTLKWHEEEFQRLSDRHRRSFLEDMSKVGKALKAALNPDRVNYELLGNAMPHLHWHVIPRYMSDPMWGRPIWAGSRSRKRLSTDGYSEIARVLKAQLSGRTSSRSTRP